ncbi:MAG: RNA methyltransferase, partial [Halobacteriovoraceae bacterium]|nr:RNA methyltransferase [Halobacteriovoraceae bacterium]
VFSYQAPHQLSVAIAMTKKDSLEQSLKIATECGACKIYFFHSQYSYNEKSWEWKDRHYKIIEGAMEQANVFRYPELIGPIDLKELLELPLHFITMSSQGAERVRTSQYQDSVLLIGPEGGWSPQELKSFHDNKITSIQLNLPILRTPTAIAASLGHIVTSHFE